VKLSKPWKRTLFTVIITAAAVLILGEVYLLSPDFRRVSIGGLQWVGASGWLVTLLDDDDYGVRSAASDALVRGGASSVPALTRGLDDPLPGRRGQAARVLERIGTPASDALPALKRRMLTDEDEFVRTQTARAFGSVAKGDPDAVAELMKLLETDDENSKVSAAEALGSMGEDGKAAIPLLTRALKDKSPRVREEAAEALGSMEAESKEAIPALIDALAEPDLKVRREMVEALGRIANSLGERDSALRDRARAAIDKVVAETNSANALRPPP
jgi:HEAT repeat protein